MGIHEEVVRVGVDPLDLIDRGFTPMLVVPVLVQLRADPAHGVRVDLVRHHLL